MTRVVEHVVEYYGGRLSWQKVVTRELSGALRHGELSRKLGRPAPVPSIFINGELAFELTPGEDELREHLDQIMK